MLGLSRCGVEMVEVAESRIFDQAEYAIPNLGLGGLELGGLGFRV